MLIQCAKMRLEGMRECFALARNRADSKPETRIDPPPAEMMERGYQRFADTAHW